MRALCSLEKCDIICTYSNERRRTMRGKNSWVLLLMLLSGIVLGGFIGEMTKGVAGLSWLNFGQSFGLNDPLV